MLTLPGKISLKHAIILLALVVAITAFAVQWYPGMILDFLREGTPFDRLALLLLIILVLPPLVERIRLPGILALIAAGVLFGPQVLGLAPKSSEVAYFFSELGKVFLMFMVGLEVNLEDFRRHARASTIFGMLTFAAPMAFGFAVGQAFGYGTNASFLIGSILASHTLLAFPILQKLGIVQTPYVLACLGATIFTDVAALLVLAVCLSAHLEGSVAPFELFRLIGSLVVYCIIVLGALPWIGRKLLAKSKGNQQAEFAFVFLAVVIAVLCAKLIHLEDIVGAFLVGIAINSFARHSAALEGLEFIGRNFFVPVFLIVVGTQLDLAGFAHSLSTGLPFVLAITFALFAGKLVAALGTQLLLRFTPPQGLTIWSLSLPQLAATLAATMTAYKTVNPAGERLIDEPVVNAVLVLIIVTATVGPILTQAFGQRAAAREQEPSGSVVSAD